MKIKKLLAVSLASLMAIGMFAGCGSSEQTSEEAKYLKEGTLVVAYDNTYPPMEYVDEKTGDTIGFDVDLAKALAKKMGRKVEFKNSAWDSIFAGLDSENYDLIISSVSINKDRLETLSLSDPYIANQQVIVSAKDGKQVKSVEELEGLKVGVQVSTTADDACTYYLEEKGMKFSKSQFDGMTEALVALEGGSVDCVVTDLAVGQFYVAKKADKFAVTCDGLTNEPIAVCAAKSNPGIITDVNAALKELKKDGTLTKISEKYFGEDLTKDIDSNLKNYDE